MSRGSVLKCFCQYAEPTYCAECDVPGYPLTEDEAQDVLSALSFFVSDYPDRKGSVITRAAMRRVSKKLGAMMRATHARGTDDEETKATDSSGADHHSNRAGTTGRAVKGRQAVRRARTKRNAKRATKSKRNPK